MKTRPQHCMTVTACCSFSCRRRATSLKARNLLFAKNRLPVVEKSEDDDDDDNDADDNDDDDDDDDGDDDDDDDGDDDDDDNDDA